MPDPSTFAAPIRILSNFIKHISSIQKYKKMKGHYIVCDQAGRAFHNSPNGLPNFLIIETSLLNPNVLKIVSRDFDKRFSGKWKTWRNEIVMNGSSGTGTYIYDQGAEIGTHTIAWHDTGKFIVRVVDLAKANLKNLADNEPSTQVWSKINDDDPLVHKFQAKLKEV